MSWLTKAFEFVSGLPTGTDMRSVRTVKTTKTGETNMAVTIKETPEGFVITSRDAGQIVPTTYTRRRDAVRGAKRRGLVVA